MSAKLEGDWPDLRGCVGTLLHFVDSEAVGVLGAFSVVSAGNGQVIGVCATHSFTELRKFGNSRPAMSHLPDLGPAKSKNERLVALRNVRAMLQFGKDVQLGTVHQVWINDDHDTAVFVAVFDKWPSSHPRLEIDLDYPKVGEIVALAGYVHSTAPSADSSWTLGRAIALRKGTITAVHFGQNRLGKHLTFETTIPAEGGLSGSPVSRYSDKSGRMALLGVLSSDFSDEASFQSHSVGGSSTCSMVWPILSLPTRVIVEETGKSIMHFHGLMDAGLVKAVSQHSSIAFGVNDGNAILTNTDMSSTPPNIYRISSPS